MTDRLLLGKKLGMFLGQVTENRAELATLGVPQSYPGLSGVLQEDSNTRSAQALKLLSKLGKGLGDLLDTVAFDLNLSPIDLEWEGSGDQPTKMMEPSLGQEEQVPQKHRMWLRPVGGECPLTQLRKIRLSLQMIRLDLESMEQLNLSQANESKLERYRETYLWRLALYRQGIKLEKSLETVVLEDQIQATMDEQAKQDPCSHAYLKILLDIENMALRKARVFEEQIIEERLLIHKETHYIRQELKRLTPASPVFKTLREKLEALREEDEKLGRA